jgi:predicted secreted protein
MSAAALAAINTLLKVGDGGSPETFNTIANVGDYTPISPSGAVVDVTSHSTGVPWRQKIITLLDAGKVQAKIFYIPTGTTHNVATGLLGFLTNRTLKNWKIVWPDSGSTTFAFSGYVTAFQPTAPVAGVVEATLTIEITGQPTLV